MKFQQKKLSKFYISGQIVLLLVLLVFIARPAWHDIKSLSNKIAKERETLEDQYLSGQLLKKTQLQFEKIQQDLPRLNSSLLKKGQELFLITTLEEAAGHRNLSQKIIMDDLPEDFNQVATLPVKVNLEGSFASLLAYLADLEKLDFYINWQKVIINQRKLSSRNLSLPHLVPAKDQELVSSNKLKITLEGETYWQAE